ncbi:hypothetical protein N7539_005729 [Penicillium diatomitis]|uniref:Uncharacterized protein n=1 Tax=Penicillium diatomitis TaxID=2819901 RepID=A0A9W9X4W3_9EURO|nr:uncharacterized protein N7539_005729 [Penicillium diatomitis]KAJ5483933.1 hypothetical protein N7539_005729 [Penicillium diatomitis]
MALQIGGDPKRKDLPGAPDLTQTSALGLSGFPITIRGLACISHPRLPPTMIQPSLDASTV